MGKLVIDLGHGGKDPGAIGPNKTCEADIVLNIGCEIDKILKGYDLDYKFTRFSDKYLSLTERAMVANRFGADYFVSIHINSSNDRSVRGVEVWQYDGDNIKLNNFSKCVCDDISKVLDIRNRGVKYNKNFTVLSKTTMPACLIEVDFISNIDAERDLKDSVNEIAATITDNFIDLFGLVNTSRDTLYKVCIGAYRDKNNAVNQVKLAKSKGFNDAYIVRMN
ncbi:N-acetylmuramoyl-L-alanine amidase [Romboutsia sp. 1001216sp1]|uniref:N-acetylmuramoyl-L-alanine amidase n=1 Tax=unclassified Romboutsia TaxID=2626894 RepID=UPI00189F4AAA|nr:MULTISPECIES: N-acetylmuramoyl-L-alanine amidase [unclassified Romboutsia]MDB8791369.1 N-acetylmuramoyl-L-alanine amidase [Romboutsia sp. 1001216sp1]MDB8794799.1 N-acetylmuramoyl-L-alanine amidase [Romboutsia sp. 1001216sp1]MDB8797677.1 N-acetylmuramoyl-L-alanine amidase [Romboutsia sp. 1001216sp1]MDB8800507.1 N-acetylmuramoyl-L-alanine amidase [Romboutsia sp. 1001216sp1]MDB8803338.1 N-acetylmuramoyl-L-alanine amidase [Romboutsia sp. 1001216sp1]